MAHIDKSGLSRVLASLVAPRLQPAPGAAPVVRSSDVSARAAVQRSRKDLELRLRRKLKALDKHESESQAADIAIREILCWEFGQEILDHPEFDDIFKSVVDAITSDPNLSRALKKVVAEMTEDKK